MARRPSSDPLTVAQMERLVARAVKRNGDNSILLDMAEDIGAIKTGVQAIQGRMNVIEPVLWKLEKQRIEGEGRRKLIGGILKIRHAVYTAIVAAAAYVGINLPKLN